ncbi:unnamed protein product, partial [Amoebophrya sp. A25]
SPPALSHHLRLPAMLQRVLAGGFLPPHINMLTSRTGGGSFGPLHSRCRVKNDQQSYAFVTKPVVQHSKGTRGPLARSHLHLRKHHRTLTNNTRNLEFSNEMQSLGLQQREQRVKVLQPHFLQQPDLQIDFHQNSIDRRGRESRGVGLESRGKTAEG